MAKLKITIDPLALIALFLFIYFGWLDEVLFYIIALVSHEYAHYIAAKKLGYSLNHMSFSPFGATLNGSNNYFKKSHEIIIALAGPLTNLVIAICLIALWWLFPDTYVVTYSFVLANVSLFVSNMLPLFPLDAGRIVLALVKDNKKFAKIYKCYRVNSIIISALLLIAFIASAFSRLNLTYLFIAILLLSSLFNIKNNIYYDYAYLDKNEEDYNKVLPVKEYYIPYGYSKYKIMKFINKHTYSVFHFVDRSGRIMKTIEEKEIISLLQSDQLDRVLDCERDKDKRNNNRYS